MDLLVSLHRRQIDVSKKYTSKILNPVSPRLDNLLLKTFGVAFKVPHFSLCCLMFLFFQMLFQVQILHTEFLWLSNDILPLTLSRPRWHRAIYCVCNTTDWWDGGSLCSHVSHFQLTLFSHCLLKSGTKIRVIFTPLEIQFFSWDIFKTKF